MPDSHDSLLDPLLGAILDSWDRNNTILTNLLRLIPQNLMDLRGTDSSHSIAQLFTHMHHCRLVSVFEDAPEIVPVEPTGEYAVEPDRERLIQKLNESAVELTGDVTWDIWMDKAADRARNSGARRAAPVQQA